MRIHEGTSLYGRPKGFIRSLAFRESSIQFKLQKYRVAQDEGAELKIVTKNLGREGDGFIYLDIAQPQAKFTHEELDFEGVNFVPSSEGETVNVARRGRATKSSKAYPTAFKKPKGHKRLPRGIKERHSTIFKGMGKYREIGLADLEGYNPTCEHMSTNPSFHPQSFKTFDYFKTLKAALVAKPSEEYHLSDADLEDCRASGFKVDEPKASELAAEPTIERIDEWEFVERKDINFNELSITAIVSVAAIDTSHVGPEYDAVSAQDNGEAAAAILLFNPTYPIQCNISDVPKAFRYLHSYLVKPINSALSGEWSWSILESILHFLVKLLAYGFQLTSNVIITICKWLHACLFGSSNTITSDSGVNNCQDSKSTSKSIKDLLLGNSDFWDGFEKILHWIVKSAIWCTKWTTRGGIGACELLIPRAFALVKDAVVTVQKEPLRFAAAATISGLAMWAAPSITAFWFSPRIYKAAAAVTTPLAWLYNKREVVQFTLDKTAVIQPGFKPVAEGFRTTAACIELVQSNAGVLQRLVQLVDIVKTSSFNTLVVGPSSKLISSHKAMAIAEAHKVGKTTSDHVNNIKESAGTLSKAIAQDIAVQSLDCTIGDAHPRIRSFIEDKFDIKKDRQRPAAILENLVTQVVEASEIVLNQAQESSRRLQTHFIESSEKVYAESIAAIDQFASDVRENAEDFLHLGTQMHDLVSKPYVGVIAHTKEDIIEGTVNVSSNTDPVADYTKIKCNAKEAHELLAELGDTSRTWLTALLHQQLSTITSWFASSPFAKNVSNLIGSISCDCQTSFSQKLEDGISQEKNQEMMIDYSHKAGKAIELKAANSSRWSHIYKSIFAPILGGSC